MQKVYFVDLLRVSCNNKNIMGCKQKRQGEGRGKKKKMAEKLR
jgi:hypothetical protein